MAYFASPLDSHDELELDGTIGLPRSMTTWEALAILVALSVWARRPGSLDCIALRADNRGALQALSSLRSRSTGISRVLREIALLEAGLEGRLLHLVHVSGVTDILPDALSRQWGPAPKPFPKALAGVERTLTPARDSRFWRLPPCKGKG